ncbi:hypothetical protein MtrunA17_Chr6g0468551 [Medicago truncatula]|uniref:Uncharacterized protein n=1 Tax=Medicago truncatula TaxID=3880 RepID=A0A396HKM5_MEDTR|nr:hypothetical protein MtrunA17_Chr6g0468551 [Medicago truncatula]
MKNLKFELDPYIFIRNMLTSISRTLFNTFKYSLRSFLSVTFGEIFCSYLNVTFKVQCNIKCCFTNIVLSYLLRREIYMK